MLVGKNVTILFAALMEAHHECATANANKLEKLGAALVDGLLVIVESLVEADEATEGEDAIGYHRDKEYRGDGVSDGEWEAADDWLNPILDMWHSDSTEAEEDKAGEANAAIEVKHAPTIVPPAGREK